MKSSQLHIYLSPEMKSQLEQNAKQWGLKLGEYIRYILLQDIYVMKDAKPKSTF